MAVPPPGFPQGISLPTFEAERRGCSLALKGPYHVISGLFRPFQPPKIPGRTSYTSPQNANPQPTPPQNPGGTSYTSYTSPQYTQLVRFSCWCPKVMAAIGRLPDTLADRCIISNVKYVKY